ncbi:hypothetical protein N7G274_008504 [Stereocaulon virgatum]|uniref:B30.2/SPRY domain-containing protein n=1 Tax=Stereocaulon virgatum TaxID=373712 RepID=A0ABR4A184_9LECA
MAENQQLLSSNPSVITQTRVEDANTPVVSSPLNPDAAASRVRTREQREKKASFKKREEGEDQGPNKKLKKSSKEPTHISPIRYKLPLPKAIDFSTPVAPTFTIIHDRPGYPAYESSEHVYSKKGFRYTRAIVDPLFPAIQYHRQSETIFHPAFNPEDTAPLILFGGPECTTITTDKGFRTARANVFAREGRFYWECKIFSGIKHDPLDERTGGHIRCGFVRREATLDGPVGFDAYSYGIRDMDGQKIHMSRPKDFHGTSFVEGDVIGLEITLPSESLHRKVVEGVYNKAVDVMDDLDPGAAKEPADIIRDRVPIRFKTHIYHEAFEYTPVKPLEDLMHPAPAVNATNSTVNDNPHPNHPEPALRTLPMSSIKVYLNGKYIGTPFTDLLAFLPPASKPLSQPGSRQGLDDGTLGYYPAISVYRSGYAEANFSKPFWFPPESPDAEMRDTPDIKVNPATQQHIAGSQSRLRPFVERFNEQIAEDVMFDLIDEVDFWSQGVEEEDQAPSGLGPNDPQAAGMEGALANGELKIMQEDE